MVAVVREDDGHRSLARLSSREFLQYLRQWEACEEVHLVAVVVLLYVCHGTMEEVFAWLADDKNIGAIAMMQQDLVLVAIDRVVVGYAGVSPATQRHSLRTSQPGSRS